MDKIKKYMTNFNIVKLDQLQLEDIFLLCKNNKKYYEYMKEEVSLDSVKDIFSDLPPNTKLKDKHLWGICKNGALIAILDLIDGYPQNNMAFIGLFMVDVDYQGQGIGAEIIFNLLRFLKDESFISCGLGVIEDNKEALKFWSKMGFKETGVVYNKEKYNVIMMSYEL